MSSHLSLVRASAGVAGDARPPAASASPRPLTRTAWRRFVLSAMALLFSAGTLSAAPIAEIGPKVDIDLRQALEWALERDPGLKAGAHEIEAADGRSIQAGLSPNPTVGIEVEDSLGTGGYRGFRRTQTTLQISQLFELGGKRDRRVEAANAARDVARSDQEVRRLDVLAKTAEAYVGVLGAQKRLAIAQERLKRTSALIPALRKRVETGASARVEITRGEVAADLARIDVDRAKVGLETARRVLAAQWGSTMPDYRNALGDLETATAPPPIQRLIDRLDDNPRLARWKTLRGAREADLQVQRSLATPDVTVGVGPRRYSESNDTGVVFSVSIPIPVNNRNQGSIIEAREELEKTGDEASAARLDLYRDVSAAYGELASAWSEIDQLRNAVLPASRAALKGVQSGYGEGRFGVIDLLDAQGTLSDAEARYGEVLVSYHAAVARIEGLNAGPIDALPSSKTTIH